MPHVQHPCYVWRRHHDRIRFPIIRHTFKISFIQPVFVAVFFYCLRLKIFRKLHSYSAFIWVGEGTKTTLLYEDKKQKKFRACPRLRNPARAGCCIGAGLSVTIFCKKRKSLPVRSGGDFRCNPSRGCSVEFPDSL